MKNLLLVLVLIALIGVSTSSFTDANRLSTLLDNAFSIHNTASVVRADTIRLPLEVMGEDGTTTTIRLMVDRAGKGGRLYLKTHSISYPAYLGYNKSKASIRLNGGKWVDINNKTAECLYPEREYGCTKGPYATLRFLIPVKDLGKLRNGVNRLDFRFNYEPGDISSGYRILEFGLQNKDGSNAIQQTEIVVDEPAEWQPISVDSTRIASGRRLFETRSLLLHRPDGASMQASCRDCHANNGRDLKYFNYSNYSIVTRSKFHGLSQEQGEDIASWIRSQPLVDKNGMEYSAPGRPWNPPYQPGPGLDEQPVHEWTAGAGLGWALEHDTKSLDYLFPSTIESVIHIDSTLSRRQLPIALQLPDWNEWLPVIHPMDTWGNVYASSRLKNNFDNVIDHHIQHPENVNVLVDELKVVQVVETYYKDVLDFAKHDGGMAVPSKLNREQMGEAMAGLFKWHLVKMWDFMHTSQFEDITSGLYTQGEQRGWFSMAQSLSSVTPRLYAEQQMYLDELSRAYYNTAWDELQVILNSGHRETVGGQPIDWAYHFEHIREWKRATGVSHGTRYLAGYIKVLQNANNRHGVRMPDGFYLGHTSLAWIHELSMPDSRENVLYEFESLDPQLRKELAEAFVKEMLNKLKRHDYNEWDRSLGQSGIGPASYKPTSGKGSQKNTFVFERAAYADHFYRIIPLYRDLGVNPMLLEELARWGRGAWPQGDWEAVIVND